MLARKSSEQSFRYWKQIKIDKYLLNINQQIRETCEQEILLNK